MPALTDAELADARAMQALAMQDTCTIERYTGTTSWDPDTETTTRDKTTIYTGACRAQAKSSTVVNQVGDTITVTTHLCAIPWDAPQIEPRDLLTVTTSADPQLTGPLTVTAVDSSTFATARHFTATLNA